MSAKHALLGLLLHRSGYPYELANRLEQRLGPAWSVNSGQLYQTVGSLEREGLIERVEGGAGGGREDRHVFAITEDGVAEFERWFERPSSRLRLSRRPLLVKLTFAGPERLEQALAKLNAYELECAQRLTELSSEYEDVARDEPQLRADRVLLRLNLSADIFQIEAELRWAKHAREMVSLLQNRHAIWPSTRERPEPAAEPEEDRRGARRELFRRMAGAERSDWQA